jgi:phosphatidylglycerophosphate synthase
LRWLAQYRVTPNQITVLGFLVALLACLLLAQGRYWQGVFGAFLLYASWVLDCMDGTLARLTFAESDGKTWTFLT